MHRQLHTPSESPLGSPGHARVQSENSISTPLRTAPFSIRFPVRASSAAARYNGRGLVDHSQPSPPLSNPSPNSPNEDTRTSSRSGFSSSLSRTSPPHGTSLEPLSEDDIVPDFEADHASLGFSMDGTLSPFGDHRGLTRSTSSMQMRDLRDQMSDLKGRLSVLRDRARDDTMKRRSLQSLRTPSPFTAAEQWYAGSKSYGDSPLSADGGVGQPPWKEKEREDENAKDQEVDEAVDMQSPGYAESEVTSIYEDVETHIATDMDNGLIGEEEEEEQEVDLESFDTAEEEEFLDKVEGDFNDDYNDEMLDREEEDDYESDASLYHDTIPPISHEDREDAFDYEHFFLHSAMGTISQQRLARRSSGASFTSEDSVETTRGPSAPTEHHAKSNKGKERISYGHYRSESTDTISTIATFATAKTRNTSENGDDEDEDEDDDNFAVQYASAPINRGGTPVTAKRSTFGGSFDSVPEAAEDDRAMETDDRSMNSTSVVDNKEDRNGSKVHRPSVGSFDSFGSTGTTRSFPLVNKPKSSGSPDSQRRDVEASVMSDSATLTEGAGHSDSPVHMLAKEDQLLVERLVASLGKCVLGLQEAGQGDYEGRVWRRRLDAARRVLEGEAGAI